MPDIAKRLAERLKGMIRTSRMYKVIEFLQQKKEYHRWQGACRQGPVPHLVKQKAIKSYASEYSLKTLIETGTHLGAMVDAMIDRFDRIISIELEPTLAESARRRFAGREHVTILHGDSTEVLPAVLRNIQGPSLFWLDGHYSGGVTARGRMQTPIVQELVAILGQSKPMHVILIDDARLFTGDNDYPTLGEVKRLADECRSGYELDVEDDIIRIHPRTGSTPDTSG